MESGSKIATLASRHAWFFYTSVGLALLTVFFSYIVWKSGNDLQDAQRRATELQVENAKAAAATANQNTEALKKENLELAIQLEQEQQQRLKLARRVGPRIITPEEKKFIVSVLRGYPNQKITVNLLASHDPEAKSFSEQLINTLKEAGGMLFVAMRGSQFHLHLPSMEFTAGFSSDRPFG
jgi:hypothetical protein